MTRRLAGLFAVPAIALMSVALMSVTGCGSEADAPADLGVVIDVRISGGTVTPSNERIDATVGRPVAVRVDSDADDELHVHAVPEKSFEIRPGAGQEFRFTVDVPGQVTLELHETGTTVATLLVRP
ncbi:MAG: hypothetical protein WAW17_14745 [Rhodococcus sp. (in: high G+C Gram-positive bacteria)]|uniref:hypothetical protein n=1 Tax=Rhodococcus sp. TaxID=1831 RepID=UPI003BB1E4F5